MIHVLFLPGCGLYAAGALVRCAWGYTGQRWLGGVQWLFLVAGAALLALGRGWGLLQFIVFALMLPMVPAALFTAAVSLITRQHVSDVALRTLRGWRHMNAWHIREDRR